MVLSKSQYLHFVKKITKQEITFALLHPLCFMASILAWQHIAYAVGKGRMCCILFTYVFIEYRRRHTLILAEEGNQVVLVGSDLAPK